MSIYSALANIFFISKKKTASITSFLKQSEHTALVDSVDFEKNQVELPFVVDVWLLELEKITKSGDMNVLRSHLVSLLASEQAKGDRDLTLVASALFSVVPKYRTWEKKGVEDAFIKNQIAGSFDILLGQDNEDILQYEWSNKKLSNCILKPDYTLFFYDEQESPVEVFVAEVKAPLRNKNSNDFIKLGFTLKSMLDGAIKRGMAKPHMLGLLVDGYNCYLYMMKIEHEAIYQMVELDTFSLPKGRNEIHLLKNLLEAIFRVKAFASEAFEDFEASNGAQSELLPLCRFVAE